MLVTEVTLLVTINITGPIDLGKYFLLETIREVENTVLKGSIATIRMTLNKYVVVSK